jgi:hypothetical protein
MFLCHAGLNPLSMHFSQISVSDLILVNEDGDVVIGDEPVRVTLSSTPRRGSPDLYPRLAPLPPPKGSSVLVWPNFLCPSLVEPATILPALIRVRY